VAGAAFADAYSSRTSADIWVYPYGGKTSTLRAWGDGTSSVAPTYPFAGSGYDHYFSYSYLGWDVSSIADGNYVVTGATLTLTQVSNCGYTQAAAEEKPIEARALDQTLSEASWSYGASTNQNPGGLFGTGSMANYDATSQFDIVIDLLAAGDFQSYFNSAVNGNNQIALALTSAKLADMSGNAPFKFWSKDDLGNEAYAPLLSVQYAAVPEPGSLIALATGVIGLLPRLRRKAG
jgi:hypothetical protein